MYKLVVFATLLAVAAAAPGLVGGVWGGAAPWGLAGAPGLVGAPVLSAPIVRAAPVVSHAVPVATSYANQVRIATPAVAVAPAPLAVAHAPVLAGLGHGW